MLLTGECRFTRCFCCDSGDIASRDISYIIKTDRVPPQGGTLCTFWRSIACRIHRHEPMGFTCIFPKNQGYYRHTKREEGLAQIKEKNYTKPEAA